MPIKLRQQLDDHDAITLECGLSCPPGETLTRGEFKDEADVNTIVARFYPFAPPMARVPQYGEQDMSLDLHGALLTVQSAREAYSEMPESIRSRFPTYSEFVQAVADGKLQILANPSEGSSEVPSEGSSEAASDSAPVS